MYFYFSHHKKWMALLSANRPPTDEQLQWLGTCKHIITKVQENGCHYFVVPDTWCASSPLHKDGKIPETTSTKLSEHLERNLHCSFNIFQSFLRCFELFTVFLYQCIPFTSMTGETFYWMKIAGSDFAVNVFIICQHELNIAANGLWHKKVNNLTWAN